MADEPAKPDKKDVPEIKIQGPKSKPEIKIRKVDADKESNPPASPPAAAGSGDAPAAPKIKISGPSTAAGEGGEKKPLKVLPDNKPRPPEPKGTDLPDSIRIRGPQGQEQSINLGDEKAGPARSQAPKAPARPSAKKPSGPDTALGPATADIKPPDTKTASRLVKSQTIAAGATRDRGPSYAGALNVKRKRKTDAGPMVGTFAGLTLVIGLAVVYMMVAQVFPDLGLPVPQLF